MASLVNRGASYTLNRAAFNGIRGQYTGISNTEGNYVRVLKPLLSKDDVSEDLWQQLGCEMALNGVFYQDMYNAETEDLDASRFAYCLLTNLYHIPAKNEIVKLERGFDVLSTLDNNNTVPLNKVYWKCVVSIWNSPTFNAFPDIISNGSGSADLGPDLKETSELPLQKLPGDVLLEGRFGQSLRMGGSTYLNGQYSSIDTESSKPYIILRNGSNPEDRDKIGTPDRYYAVKENVNTDLSSIYMTSNQSVPLEQSSTKFASLKEEDRPVLASAFKDNSQILTNSDRFFLNSRQDTILSSGTQLALTSGTCIGLDSVNYISLDASKLYLGKESLSESEPVLKGNKTIEWLKDLCQTLQLLIDNINRGVMTGDSKAVSTALAAASKMFNGKLDSLSGSSRVNELKSNKVFVE